MNGIDPFSLGLGVVIGAALVALPVAAIAEHFKWQRTPTRKETPEWLNKRPSWFENTPSYIAHKEKIIEVSQMRNRENPPQ